MTDFESGYYPLQTGFRGQALLRRFIPEARSGQPGAMLTARTERVRAETRSCPIADRLSVAEPERWVALLAERVPAPPRAQWMALLNRR